MMKLSTKKIAIAGVLTSLSLITFIIESLFPPLFVPGAKMGLSNIFILLILLLFGGWYAFSAVIIKCLLGSLFIGNFSSVMYSLPAGILCLVFEYVLIAFFYDKFSIIAISVFSAIIHNVVQNIIFCLVIKGFEALAFLPYLTLLGAIAGLFVGLIVYVIIKFLPLRFFNDAINTR